MTFVCKARLEAGMREKYSAEQEACRGGEYARRHLQGLDDPQFRDADIDVDPETYEVRADGELLTCEPATVLPMAQRYFLF